MRLMEVTVTVAPINQLEKAIEKVLSDSFVDVKILSVMVTEDVDFDGDDILRVSVVFDGAVKDLQGNIIAKAIRKIRPTMEELDWPAFPSLSFMTREDAKVAACS